MMEHARVIIAIALSFLVFLLWDFFFTPEKQPVQQAEKEQQTTQETQPLQTTAKPDQPAIAPAPPAPQTPVVGPQVKKSIRTIVVDTPLYVATFSEGGAVIKSFVLKKFRETVAADSPLKEIISPELPNGSFWVSTRNQSITGLSQAVFSTTDPLEINVVGQKETLKFAWVSPTGMAVEKVFRFSPDSYLVDLEVTLKNGSATPVQDSLVLSMTKDFESAGTSYGFEGPSAFLDDSLEQIKIKNIEDENSFNGKIDWIALEGRYFMSAVLPVEVIKAGLKLGLTNETRVTAGFVQPEAVIHPGTQKTYVYQLFNGPRSWTLLRGYNSKLDKAVNFGMFDILAKPCLWLMNTIYAVLPNYGIAIIILTLITKFLLWPLGTKSYKSMHQMKKLQPLIKEIREKYKDDKKKMNEETMALYRTYKINPLGGCLPMVVQIPVFFALYRMLYQAIELRHAPFFLWINDLSSPDRLFSFDFSIPFMQPPFGIPVLTIIMGATMLLQQKMQPPMGDPTQAKMMMLMPVVFTFIFINFSSGLVLYWLVNNVFSILQQYYTNKRNK